MHPNFTLIIVFVTIGVNHYAVKPLIFWTFKLMAMIVWLTAYVFIPSVAYDGTFYPHHVRVWLVVVPCGPHRGVAYKGFIWSPGWPNLMELTQKNTSNKTLKSWLFHKMDAVFSLSLSFSFFLILLLLFLWKWILCSFLFCFVLFLFSFTLSLKCDQFQNHPSFPLIKLI